MNRAERAELAELIVRWGNLRVAESEALHAQRPDMAEWARTGDACREAYRELWEALFRIEIHEPEEAPQRVVKLPAHSKRLENEQP